MSSSPPPTAKGPEPVDQLESLMLYKRLSIASCSADEWRSVPQASLDLPNLQPLDASSAHASHPAGGTSYADPVDSVVNRGLASQASAASTVLREKLAVVLGHEAMAYELAGRDQEDELDSLLGAYKRAIGYLSEAVRQASGFVNLRSRVSMPVEGVPVAPSDYTSILEMTKEYASSKIAFLA